jgi:hypothetical protein
MTGLLLKRGGAVKRGNLWQDSGLVPYGRKLTQALVRNGHRRPHLLGGLRRDVAVFLCRDEDEVRQKAKDLGLVEHPGTRRNLRVVR